MPALNSALRTLPAALAVSLLSGCAWYTAAWEREQGSRPHNHPAVTQAGNAHDDGNVPTPAKPDAAEPKSDDQPADEMKPAEPAPETKAQRKAREKAEKERLRREEAERDSLERAATEQAQAQAAQAAQAQPHAQPQPEPQLQSSSAAPAPQSAAPEHAMNADHSETESMRAWRMGQQRIDLMLKFSSSDDHLVAIMLATDNTDISYARMAYAHASTREVKAFAQRMINDHSQAVALVTEIIARNDISPKDNIVSRDLRDEATGQREIMRPLTGRSFDSAYVANEVTYHRRLLSMIDDVLLPRLDDGELRQQLVTMRPVLSAHLAHAEQLQATLDHR